MNHDPNWTAPHGQEGWRDEHLLRFTGWLRSFAGKSDIDDRVDAVRKQFIAAQSDRRDGAANVRLYDPKDKLAWYIFQGETYAIDRLYWVPEEVVRIAPVLGRLGEELDTLKSVRGLEDRARNLVRGARSQPDGPLFELLVALAYRRRGWNAEFAPEGKTRIYDIDVSRPRSKWAVECKRLMPSSYADQEKKQGEALAAPVHAFCRERDLSFVVELAFEVEIKDVPADYVIERLRKALTDKAPIWKDEIAMGRVRAANWPLTNAVLAKDYVYYGSSRMIELLAGEYLHAADHSLSARWTPALKRPLYADKLEQASVVSWFSLSQKAVEKKSKHFKKVVSDAEGQLPSDKPGVIHVGVEAKRGYDVASMRHIKNFVEARVFEPRASRLRWIYCSYFEPEMTTAHDESWAVTETTLPYKVGSHSTKWPLPGHMLLCPEAGA